MSDGKGINPGHSIYREQDTFEIAARGASPRIGSDPRGAVSHLLAEKPWEKPEFSWIHHGLPDETKQATLSAYLRLPPTHTAQIAISYWREGLTRLQQKQVSFRCLNGRWSCQIREPGVDLSHAIADADEDCDWLIIDADQYLFPTVLEFIAKQMKLPQKTELFRHLPIHGIWCQEIPPSVSGDPKTFSTFHFSRGGAETFVLKNLLPYDIDLARGNFGGSGNFVAHDYEYLLGLTRSLYTHTNDLDSRGMLGTDSGDSDENIYLRTSRGLMMITPRAHETSTGGRAAVFEPTDNNEGAQILLRDKQTS